MKIIKHTFIYKIFYPVAVAFALMFVPFHIEHIEHGFKITFK